MNLSEMSPEDLDEERNNLLKEIKKLKRSGRYHGSLVPKQKRNLALKDEIARRKIALACPATADDHATDHSSEMKSLTDQRVAVS
jgi:hypothetical protein